MQCPWRAVRIGKEVRITGAHSHAPEAPAASAAAGDPPKRHMLLSVDKAELRAGRPPADKHEKRHAKHVRGVQRAAVEATPVSIPHIRDTDSSYTGPVVLVERGQFPGGQISMRRVHGRALDALAAANTDDPAAMLAAFAGGMDSPPSPTGAGAAATVSEGGASSPRGARGVAAATASGDDPGATTADSARDLAAVSGDAIAASSASSAARGAAGVVVGDSRAGRGEGEDVLSGTDGGSSAAHSEDDRGNGADGGGASPATPAGALRVRAPDFCWVVTSRRHLALAREAARLAHARTSWDSTYKVLCHGTSNSFAVFVLGVVVYTKFYPIAFGIAANERGANLLAVLNAVRDSLPPEAVAAHERALPAEAVVDGHASFPGAAAASGITLFLCHVHGLRTATQSNPTERRALTHLVCAAPTTAAWDAGAALLAGRAPRGIAALRRWGRPAQPCFSPVGRATHTCAAEGWNRGFKAGQTKYRLHSYRMLQELLIKMAAEPVPVILAQYPQPKRAEVAAAVKLARRLTAEGALVHWPAALVPQGLAQSLGTDGEVYAIGAIGSVPALPDETTWDAWVKSYVNTAYVRWGPVPECSCSVFRRLLACCHTRALRFVLDPASRPPDFFATPGRLVPRGAALTLLQAIPPPRKRRRTGAAPAAAASAAAASGAAPPPVSAGAVRRSAAVAPAAEVAPAAAVARAAGATVAAAGVQPAVRGRTMRQCPCSSQVPHSLRTHKQCEWYGQ